MLESLMVVGLGIPFWITIGIWFFVGVYLCDDERWAPTSISLFVLLGVLWAITKTNPFVFVWENIYWVIYYSILYLGLGICWSYIKWGIYLSDIIDKFKRENNSYISSNNLDMSNISNMSFREYLIDFISRFIEKNYGYDCRELFGKYCSKNNYMLNQDQILSWIRPYSKYRKSKIMYWITWWPNSFVSTLFHDAIQRLVQWAYELVAESFNRISERRFAKIDLGISIASDESKDSESNTNNEDGEKENKNSRFHKRIKKL